MASTREPSCAPTPKPSAGELVVSRLADHLPPVESAAPQAGQESLPYADAAAIIPDARMQVLKQLLERHDRRVEGDRQVLTAATDLSCLPRLEAILHSA